MIRVSLPTDIIEPGHAKGTLGVPPHFPRSTSTAASGFTLAEVLVVAAIVGILASVSIPVYTSYLRTQKQQAALGLSQTLAITAGSWMRRNGSVPLASDLTSALPVPLPPQYSMRIDNPDATTHFVVIIDGSNPSALVLDSSRF